MFSLGTEAPRAFLPLVDISPRRLSSSCLRGLGCRRASGYEAIGWGEVLTIVGDSYRSAAVGRFAVMVELLSCIWLMLPIVTQKRLPLDSGI